MARTHALLTALLLLLVACSPFRSGNQSPLDSPVTPVTQATIAARTTPTAATGAETEPSGEAAILAAYEERVSGIIVQVEGSVQRTLADDNDGSRHQRFILELPSGHTVLVAHNIDVAPRVEGLARGDRVVVRGEYEWNEQGGVIHWTHHDPQGRHEDGFIEFEGMIYQ